MTLWEKAWPILLVFGVLILIFVAAAHSAAQPPVFFAANGTVFLHRKAAEKMMQKGICCAKQLVPFLFFIGRCKA